MNLDDFPNLSYSHLLFMKPITFTLLALLCLSFSRVHAQTSLAAGDIAFVGWSSIDDGNNGSVTNDQIAFVILKDLAPNTIIYFTDFGWANSPESRFQNEIPCGGNQDVNSEGIIKWTSGANALSCGTYVWIKVKYLGASAGQLTNIGTVTGIHGTATAANAYVSLPTSGDQVFAFQGGGNSLATGLITNPVLIAGFNCKVAWDANLNACTPFMTGSSTLPPDLINASFIIPSQNGSDLSSRRNARFNCSGNTTASPGVLRAAMLNSQNWIFNQIGDASGVYNFPSFGCTFTCSQASPDITTQPQNQVTCDGKNAAFTIVASNTTGYQWQISTDNGGNYVNLSNAGVYSGVTSSTLNISNATGLSGNFYRCVVSNAIPASVNSNGVSLTVNRFVQQPFSMTSCSSCAAGFTASARGIGLTYQWQVSTDNGANFSNITDGGVYSGTNTKTLAIASASGLNGRQYQCILGGCASPINSNAAILTVSGAAQTPLTQGDVAIVGYNSADDGGDGTIQDDEIVFVLLKDIVAGTEVTLSDAVWRSDNQTFINPCSNGILKWIATSNLTCGTQVKIKSKYLAEVNTGVVIPLQMNTSFYISLNAADVLFAFQGTIASPTLLYGLHMNAWTASVNSCATSVSALPTVLNAAGFNVALGRDGSANKNWTNANYNCSNVNASPSSLRASIGVSSSWSTTTSPISFPVCTFSCTNGAPQITSQPNNFTTCNGRTATFSVTASDANSFKWQIFNGVGWDYLANNAIYTNVTTNTLTINDGTGLNGKQYRCEVTNVVTSVYSNSAVLTVNRFINQPVNMTTCVGCEAAFSVVADGNGLAYQWQESSDGGANFGNISNAGVYSGVTTNILKIANASSPTNLHNRQYRVILGGCPNPINSEQKTLTVSGSASTVVAGDITFIGYNSDDDDINGLTKDDEFAFILLKDINAGTQINFTDFGWRSDANAFQQAAPVCNEQGGSTGDGILKWIAGSNLTCGTQVVIKSKFTLQSNTGVCYGVQSIFNNPIRFVSLNTVGDQIFAFTGTYANPTLIAGLSMRSWDATLTNCELTSAKSVKPAALNGYVVEFVGASASTFASYKCSAPTKDVPSVVRAATQNTANWDVSDVTRYTFPLTCSFCCSASFTITGQPTNSAVCVGSGTSFSITISTVGPTFQWQVNTGSGFANIPAGAPYSGINGTTLTINPTSAGMNNYQYRCVITDLCGNTNSNAGTLTFISIANATNITPSAPMNVNQPNSIQLTASCGAGSQVVWYGSLTATTVLGTGSPFTYTPNSANSETYVFYALCKQTAAPNCVSNSRVATAAINFCGVAATNLPTITTTRTVRAGTSISGNNLIDTGANVTYQAGTFIELLPGFRALTGAVFKTQFGGCQ